jgi:hypothetical protein
VAATLAATDGCMVLYNWRVSCWMRLGDRANSLQHGIGAAQRCGALQAKYNELLLFDEAQTAQQRY